MAKPRGPSRPAAARADAPISRRRFLRRGAAALAGAACPAAWPLRGLTLEADLAVRGGLLMDPWSGRRVRADLYLKDGKILYAPGLGPGWALTRPPSARRELDATGLVVSPGFLDIHCHEGALDQTMEAMALEGVTTMIAGNCGTSLYPLGQVFGEMERQGALINFASYVGANLLRELVGVPSEFDPATPEQTARMVALAEAEMAAGALGVSYGIQYHPGSSWEEVLALGRAAARCRGLTAAHSRDGGVGQSALAALEEMIRLCRETGAPHQYSHIGSMLAYGEVMDRALAMLDEARAQGLAITTDIYPYDASMASINAAQLDLGVFDRFACLPSDLELLNDVVIDGRLFLRAGRCFADREQYAYVREMTFARRTETIPIIVAHIQKWDKIRLAMGRPYTCICSDGAVFAVQDDPGSYEGHPRVAGSRARWLGRFVREEGLTDLMTGLFKLTALPAMILGLEGKGRLAAGADADVVAFDPDEVLDRATYGEGFLLPPLGIRHVVVNGRVAVEDGALAPGAPAGRPLRRTWTVPGWPA
jgi:N-acyl-D-amino-acid deacylase